MASKQFKWWKAAVVVAVMLAFAAWLRPEPTEAQFGQPDIPEQALPGQGMRVDIASPIQIIASNLPIVRGGSQAVQEQPERYVIDEKVLEAAKRQAAIPGFAPQLPATLTAPAIPGAATPGAVVSFDGDYQGEVGCGGWIPADQALAVGDGANPVIQAVNECLSVWSLGGTRLLGPVSLQSFFGQPSTVSVCDPRALFDWRNHRFIVMAIKCSAPYGQSYVAVSQTDSAVGGWWVYTFGSSSSPGAIMDYPRMGQDHSVNYPGQTTNPGAIYIAYNQFNPGFINEEWHILPKNRMYAGASVSYWAFWSMTSGGLLTDSTQPANVWSPYERPRAEFLVTSKNEGVASNLFTVWSISNPFGFNVGGDGPRLSGVVISAANTHTPPPNATQPGGPATIDTLDNRISGAVTYAHGHLHAAIPTANQRFA